MIGFLEDIWHGILSIPYLIIDGIVMVFNAIVAALAAFAQFLIGLLPSFPDPPESPGGGVVGFFLWIVPLGALLAGFAILITVWIAWLAIQVALRWVKVV